MQFKKDKYFYNRYEYIVEGEWLNGVPHGVCIIDREDIRGLYTFTHGKYHGGPAWLEIKDYGRRVSWEYNDNGECKGIFREYCSD